MLALVCSILEAVLVAGLFGLAVAFAQLEKMNRLIWGLIAAAVCVGCLFLPWFYVRVAIAAGVLLGAMMVRKLIRGPLG